MAVTAIVLTMSFTVAPGHRSFTGRRNRYAAPSPRRGVDRYDPRTGEGSPDLPDYDWTVDSSDLKGRLGGVHFQKIRMADEVYVVDPGGYLGESTRREVAYAESLGKPVRYLSRERLARTGDGPQE